MKIAYYYHPSNAKSFEKVIGIPLLEVTGDENMCRGVFQLPTDFDENGFEPSKEASKMILSFGLIKDKVLEKHQRIQ